MNYRDHITALVGLNKDNDPRYLKEGEYSEARNIRVSTPQDVGKGGLVQNLISTNPIRIYDPKGGDEDDEYDSLVITLGEAEWEERDAVYILAYVERVDTGGTIDQFRIIKHDILETDPLKKYTKIYEGDADAWGITKKRIYNPKIIDGQLIFTDNENDIRLIDLDRIEKTTSVNIGSAVEKFDRNKTYTMGDAVFYGDSIYLGIQFGIPANSVPPENPSYWEYKAKVEEMYFSKDDINQFVLAASPPRKSPEVSYDTDTTRATNHLRGKVWQFTYRYTYRDYRKSVFAVPSVVQPPDKEEMTDGKQVGDPSTNNVLRITINTGSDEIRKVEVIARSSEDPATWRTIKEFDIINDLGEKKYSSNTEITFSFYNDEIGGVVDLNEVLKLYQYVPITAKHMEVIEGNMLVFGNIREGYTRIVGNVDVKLSWENYDSISSEEQELSYHVDEEQYSEDPNDGSKYNLGFLIPEDNPGSCRLSLRIKNDDGDHTSIYDYDGTGTYPDDAVNGIVSAINTDWGSGTAGTTSCIAIIPSNGFCGFERNGDWNENPYAGWIIEWKMIKSSVTKTRKYNALKKGATHKWGIVYKDGLGRMSNTVATKQMKLVIPFVTQNMSSNIYSKPIVKFDIHHKPPEWASTYEIVYAGNKTMSWFLHLLGYNFAPGKLDHTLATTASTNDTNDTYRIRVKDALSGTRNMFGNWSVEEYSFQQGDRLRIIGKVKNDGTLTQLYAFVYDAEVVGVYEDTDFEDQLGGATSDEVTHEWLYFRKLSEYPVTPTTSPGFTDHLYVEIYRPVSNSDTQAYYTTGMVYEIGTDANGNKYHKGDTDQIIDSGGIVTTPAQVNNLAFDVWMYQRNFRGGSGLANALWCESQYPSDYYLTEKMTSSAKIIANIPPVSDVLTKRLRHGGKLSVGTKLNYLADFEYDDYKDFPDEHGAIEGLRLVAFVLKVLQATKVSSIYIGRSESFTSDGKPIYTFVERVFGSVRPSIENWGTTDPASVVVNDRHLYYWDQNKGIVVRNAANGQVAVSEYGMSKYFSDKASKLAAVPQEERLVSFVFYFNGRERELYCMFGAENDQSLGEILIFNEDENHWKNAIDIPEAFKITNYSFSTKLFSISDDTMYAYEWYAGSDYMNILGTRKTGRLVLHSKSDPLAVNMFKSIIVYQAGETPKFNTVIVREQYSEAGRDMETSIFDSNIKKREGVYYCQILRDKNTPGDETENEKLINGLILRGTVLELDMKFEEHTKEVTLFSVIVNGTKSERSK